MKNTVTFALYKGFTYTSQKAFLQSELNEDQIAASLASDQQDMGDMMGMSGQNYYCVTDFDDKVVIFCLDWGDTLYQADYSIANAGGGPDVTWGTPFEVAATTTYIKVAEMSGNVPHVEPKRATVSFSTSDVPLPLGNVTSDSTAWVTRTGPLFVAGDYPDKEISITPDDLSQMVATFKPVINRVSHANGTDRTPTIFDEHMGMLENVALGDEPNILYGTVRIPKWLDDFQKSEKGGGPLKASIEIDRVTKSIVGNTLIPNPRVPTAALMSAYAAFTKETNPMGAPTEQTPETVSAAEFATLKAQAESDRAELARLRNERRDERAASFADAQIRAGKAVPATRAAIIATFAQAFNDDYATPATITFSVGDETRQGTRVDQLTALWETMPKSVLVREMVPGEHVLTGFSDGADSEEKKKKDAYEQGRKYAESMNGKNGR